MKLIIATIQPTKLQAVREALSQIEVHRMTVSDVCGYGRQKGQTAFYRGHEYRLELLRKIQLEILVNEDFLDRTIDCLLKVGRTGADGNIGDGKIFVVPAEQCIRIDDTQRGPGAV